MMDRTTYTHAYVGTAECGCIVAAVVDMPESRFDTARSVYEFIAEGLAVSRIPLDGFTFSTCEHQQPRKVIGKRLYEVNVFLRAYAVADNEEEAHEIIDEYLPEIVYETKTEAFVRTVTPADLDPDWRDAHPWARGGEERTCQAILEIQQEVDPRQKELFDVTAS